MLSSIGYSISVEGRGEGGFAASSQPMLLGHTGRFFDLYMKERQVKRLEKRSTGRYIG
jgi:hypothetical protein